MAAVNSPGDDTAVGNVAAASYWSLPKPSFSEAACVARSSMSNVTVLPA